MSGVTLTLNRIRSPDLKAVRIVSARRALISVLIDQPGGTPFPDTPPPGTRA